jgi:hypothetical protein
MSTSLSPDIQQYTERFFTMVKSLHEFDLNEVRSVIDTLQSPGRREQCFIGSYKRSSSNIATLLELKSAKHFQTIVMLTRSLFELAVDIRLIGVVQDSCTKMVEFVDVEKLRSARKAQRFKSDHPNAQVDTTIYDLFVANNERRIDDTKRTLWPRTKKLSHWSGMELPDRVKLLNPPFEEIYAVHYPHLSWQVHSGLTGVVNLKAETFTAMCGLAFKLAADSYRETLLTMIDEFALENANPEIKAKLKVARTLPFTETREQEDILRELSASE